MKKYIFKKLDAFSNGNSTGNPAGAIFLENPSDITKTEMQQIAFELKGFVSEVVYVGELPDNEFILRYFSCIREVDFCGHGTIAVMYDLIRNCGKLIKRESIIIHTPVGKLTVHNRIDFEDAVYITAVPPVFHKTKIYLSDTARALNIPESFIGGPCLEVINAGLNVLLVPVNGLENCLAIKPNLKTLCDYCLSIGADVAAVFTSETYNNGNLYHSRVFAPTYGYMEDPATGTGNAALGYYLLKHGLWDGAHIRIEQGPYKTNPNIIHLNTVNGEGNSKRVQFGGNAALKIEGIYTLKESC